MDATEKQVLEPVTMGPEGLPDKNHIASAVDPAQRTSKDEEAAREAAKLRPERAAKFSDYYVSSLAFLHLGS